MCREHRKVRSVFFTLVIDGLALDLGNHLTCFLDYIAMRLGPQTNPAIEEHLVFFDWLAHLCSQTYWHILHDVNAC